MAMRLIGSSISQNHSSTKVARTVKNDEDVHPDHRVPIDQDQYGAGGIQCHADPKGPGGIGHLKSAKRLT